MNTDFNNQLLSQNAEQQYPNPQPFETQGGNTQQINQFQYQGQSQDSQIRVDFFLKIYTFLTIEFMLNFGMIALGLYTRMGLWLIFWGEKCLQKADYCEFRIQPSWLFYVSLFVSLTLQFTLYFGGNILRKASLKYLVILLYIVFFGFTFTTICIFMVIYFWVFSEWIIWGITFLIIAQFTIFGFLKKREISLSFGAIIICGTTIPIILILILVDYYYFIWEKVVCALVIIIYGFYLNLETQLILGSGILNLQTDDYWVGSLLLYGLMLQPLVRIVELVQNILGSRNR